MNILVCVKQVPDATDVRFDTAAGTLERENSPARLNPLDGYALETAMRLKEAVGGTLIGLTMGTHRAEAALKDALAIGADEVYTAVDDAFAGADIIVTARVLAASIRRLEEKYGAFDVIFCGRQSTDSASGMLGAALAAQLGIPEVTGAAAVAYENDTFTVTRPCDAGHEVLTCALPAVVTVGKTAYDVRYGSILAKMEANHRTLPFFTLADLKLTEADCDPLCRVTGLEKQPKRKECVQILGDSAQSKAHSLVGTLAGQKII